MAVTALFGCSAAPTEPPPPTPTLASPSSSGAEQAVVTDFFAAARRGDRPAFDATVSTTDPTFADRARLLFDNLRTLPFSQLDADVQPGRQVLAPARRRLLGEAAWVQPVTVRWWLTGEARPAEHTVWLTFVRQGRPLIVGTIDGPAAPAPRPQPTWWLGPVLAARQDPATVVVGAGQSPGPWLARTRRAASEAQRWLPREAAAPDARELVVEVPATTADFEFVVGSAPGSAADIAAVTLAAGPTADAALRIVVNPAAARRLTEDGLQVTLTHEAVHVLTRSPDSPAPIWAVEGLADFVALAAHPGAQPAVAEPLLRTVRANGAPATLPVVAAFAAGSGDLDLAYAEAWTACRYVAQTASPQRLGRFYHRLDQGRTLDQAADEVLGVSGGQLADGWRRALLAEARGR